MYLFVSNTFAQDKKGVYFKHNRNIWKLIENASPVNPMRSMWNKQKKKVLDPPSPLKHEGQYIISGFAVCESIPVKSEKKEKLFILFLQLGER